MRRGYATLEAFKRAVDADELGDCNDTSERVSHPRWVRINTLKSSLEAQLTTTFGGYQKAGNIDAVLGARGDAKIFFEDTNIPNLLALPPKTDLSKTAAYADGHIILQDKASCFPAYLLDVGPNDGDVIDGCAAPGNKTTHLAAILFRGQEWNKKQKVIAFERDKIRSSTLQKMVKLASADRMVVVKAKSDFLAADPNAEEFAQVGAILLDPSCSGSGIVGRDDAVQMHLPEAGAGTLSSSNGNKNRKRKRGQKHDGMSTDRTPLRVTLEEPVTEEMPVVDKSAERLEALSTFQLLILTHAMRFPKARKITYSTCSVHFEENERVVALALASAPAREGGWRLLRREHQPDGLRNWTRRGCWDADKWEDEANLSAQDRETICESSIRCEKGSKEGTMGFFVAGFIRDHAPANVPSSIIEDHVVEERNDEEEWNGFSDDDDAAASELVPAAVRASKQRKKQRKFGRTL